MLLFYCLEVATGWIFWSLQEWVASPSHTGEHLRELLPVCQASKAPWLQGTHDRLHCKRTPRTEKDLKNIYCKRYYWRLDILAISINIINDHPLFQPSNLLVAHHGSHHRFASKLLEVIDMQGNAAVNDLIVPFLPFSFPLYLAIFWNHVSENSMQEMGFVSFVNKCRQIEYSCLSIF